MVARIVLPGVGRDGWPVLGASALLRHCVRPALKHTGPEGAGYWWGPLDLQAWRPAYDAVRSLPAGPDRDILDAVAARRDAARERARAEKAERERRGIRSWLSWPVAGGDPAETALRMECIATAAPGPGSIITDDGRFAPAVVFSLGPVFDPSSYAPVWKRTMSFAVSVEHGEDVELTLGLLDSMFDARRDMSPWLSRYGDGAVWDDVLMRDGESAARAMSCAVPPSVLRADALASMRHVERIIAASGRAGDVNDAILAGTDAGYAFGAIIPILDLPDVPDAVPAQLAGLIADSTGDGATAMTVSTFYRLGRKRFSIRTDDELGRRMGGSDYRGQLKLEYLSIARRLIAGGLPAPADDGERFGTRCMLLARMGVSNIIAQLILDDRMSLNDARRVTKRLHRRLTTGRNGVACGSGDMPPEMITADILDGLSDDADWKRLRRLAAEDEAGFSNDFAPRPWRENATAGLLDLTHKAQ